MCLDEDVFDILVMCRTSPRLPALGWHYLGCICGCAEES